ncbi:MAG: NitT/TauT family transport system substrate-binding protein, partial [Candidatus Binatota bacterium]|nr:NitT/TauT family transport system substrate-binding protein [Candidatus Binatota bacterium]
IKAKLFLLVFLLAGLPARAAELRSLTLGLVSPNLSTQLPIVVGQQVGFFKEEGLSVHGVTIASGGTLMVAILTSGHADLVVSGVAPIMRAIDRGAPVSVVAGFQNKIDFALIGSKRVARLEDLRGKTIGVTSAGSFSEFAVLEAMKRHGFIRDKDYQLIAAGSTHLRIGALKGGKVDAIPLSSGERHTLEDEGYPVLMEIGRILPEIPLAVLVAAKQFAAKEPEYVARFIRALAKSIALIKRDREKAIQFAIAGKLRGNPDIQRRALNYFAQDLGVEIERENIVALLTALAIKGEPDNFFDRSYLARAGVKP